LLISEFLVPLLRVAPQLLEKDLAEFCNGGNFGISSPFTKRCTINQVKDLAEVQRDGNSGISGPRKFYAGAEISALGWNFWP
jgi:hypothetical protein